MTGDRSPSRSCGAIIRPSAPTFWPAPFEITAGARRVTVDAAYDPAANPLRARRQRHLADRCRERPGPSISARPTGPMAAPWPISTISTRPGSRCAASTTPSPLHCPGTRDRFPCAWLWYELGGTHRGAMAWPRPHDRHRAQHHPAGMGSGQRQAPRQRIATPASRRGNYHHASACMSSGHRRDYGS